ncbi:hypothetical protein MARLIPOL_00488 [Marinobacter lipolyticus SM19]|uniref:Uncharacterized protein n=1 Tax=Marinobacter lipolyticus SM19 TaxID=1318628 RepID=R8B5T8_9GAMM|nr:hypothetical protein MARLIPOL_00488 [Marinobacter lipolyticus SM19]
MAQIPFTGMHQDGCTDAAKAMRLRFTLLSTKGKDEKRVPDVPKIAPIIKIKSSYFHQKPGGVCALT